VSNPSQPIHDLPLLTPQEKHQLLIEWNDTKVDYPADKTIHQLFEEQVKKTPNNIAARDAKNQLTYKELNERSNQLAHYLIQNYKLNKGAIVGVCLERSVNLIVSLLGIMKTGAAYVPIDLSCPKDRISFILKDTRAVATITENKHKGSFLGVSSKLILLDEEKTYIDKQNKQNLQNFVTPDSIIYTIYTSGSTGQPKGAILEHRGIVNLVSWYREEFNLSRNDISCQFASFGFDVFICETLPFLISGGTVHFINEDIKRDPRDLLNWLDVNKITFCELPVSLGAIVLEEELPKTLSLRILKVGGEKVKTLPNKLFPFDIVNIYGPTEVSVDSFFSKLYSISPKPCHHFSNLAAPPIGRPIHNLQAYIIDKHMQPVPIGVIGEICISGTGVGRGYLNNPQLTAEKFINNPFSHAENYTLYKTGDLGRYLSDGNIEFVRRADDQVKIRGFRIELGEIESTLVSHENVSQVVVMAREDKPGHKQLVAYIVVAEREAASSLTCESILSSSSGDSFSVLAGESLPAVSETLRNHLALSLPDYMVPSFFVYVDKIPLTSNGKVDRKSLPAPDLSLRSIADEYVAPQSTLELSLSSIWSEVLKVEKIGIHDNFFKIGGHSLLATQVISRIRHAYNIDIPLRALFEQPTIAALGKVVDSLIKQNSSSLLPSITPQERPDSIPLSFAQQRLWFIEQLLPDNTLYNIPLALTLKGHLNVSALENALNTLIQRHESLRTIFVSVKDQAAQVILPHLSLHLEECSTDLSHLPQEEKSSLAQSYAQEEVSKPFDLSSGPLIRVKLLNLNEDEHLLLLTMHHIISDGWSMGIFFKELSHLYNAYVSGKEPTLSPLALQYADFSLWQRNWLQGDVLDQQLSYWKEQLSDIPDLLELPTDKPRPKEMTYRGDSFTCFLPRDVKEKLNQLSQQNQSSLFMTLLAVFQTLLYRYTGQEDIVVGSPIANRHYKETEDLIGFFVNTLALRTTFQEKDSFVDVLKRVQQTTLGAYQHQDVPFEQLVDHLNVDRSLNTNPVFQVMFIFENASEREDLTLRNLQTEPFYTPYPIAKFDLLLSTFEDEDKVGLRV
jgi:amino acid adenylation domain-containing protein